MGNSDHGTTYMRVGGYDGELRPWHYIYVHSIEVSGSVRVNASNGNPKERWLGFRVWGLGLASWTL